jgi:hypothetical protein
MPTWINVIGSVSLLCGICCCAWISWDETKHPHKMSVMNVVWPITALYGGPLALGAYVRLNRQGVKDRAAEPSAVTVAKGATHCGAGCTLGDISAESLLLLLPSLATVLGVGWLWQDRIFSAWILDFILAFAFGIAFQFFSIKPMHPEMSSGKVLSRALQADALSLTAWQIGMYAVMAMAHFIVFPDWVRQPLEPGTIAFWWVMQVAMLVGFATAYPVNSWLISRGIKEAM